MLTWCALRPETLFGPEATTASIEVIVPVLLHPAGPPLHTNTMTTSTITWHPPTNLPDAETNVLLGIDVDGIKTSCEGFLSDDMHGNPCWYDVTITVLR